MLRFFRQIRQRLLTDNKFSKYLLYAVGEILLVVIGILIALQIDTWNEARKNRIYEKQVLAQIKLNLMQDRNTLECIAKNFQGAIEATGKLLDPSARIAFPDSVPYWLGQVAQFDRFQPLTNSYEVLKSKGLDIISSDTVRLLLGQYYDDKIATSSQSIGDIEISFNNHWIPLMENHVADFKFKDYLRVTSTDTFINETNVLRILTLNRDNYSAGLTNVQSVIRHIDVLLSELP
jgi:hypothetical protein